MHCFLNLKKLFRKDRYSKSLGTTSSIEWKQVVRQVVLSEIVTFI